MGDNPALIFAISGAGAGFAWAAHRWDWQAAWDLAPAICASALLSWCFAWLIWPVLPEIWARGFYHEAVGGFVASLLPALVGGLVDPDAPRFKQAQQTAVLGSAFVLGCFIGVPFVAALGGAL